jgi:curved DNA-binding protein CbpA
MTGDKAFVDHYAILGLDCWATSEEIKAAFRRLRAEFFRADVNKYRALQAAYDALVDVQARQSYDMEYRSRVGLPVPQSPTLSIVDPDEEYHTPVEEHDEKTPMEGDSGVEMQRFDPNFVLKNHKTPQNAMIGTRPYASFIPILNAYKENHKHPRLKCRMPEYILEIAVHARP